MPLKLSWEMDIKSRSMWNPFPPKEPSTPLVVADRLYVTTASGTIHDMDYETGAIRWAFMSDYQIDSAPAHGFGSICFGTADGIFRCLNDTTGAELWRFAARSVINVSPLILKDKVIFTSSDDRVHALDLKTGAKLWTYTRGTFQSVANMPASSPAFFENRIIQLFSDGMLASIDAATGKEQWLTKVYKNFKFSERRRTTPLIARSSVFILDTDGALLTIDAATGAVKSTQSIIKARDFILAGTNDIIVLDAETLMSFNSATGAINWKNEITGKDAVSIFAAGDYVFAVSNYTYYTWNIESLSKTRSRIEAFNIKSGASAWKTEFKGTIGSASFAAGRLYTLTDAGFLMVHGKKGCIICSKNMIYADKQP